MARKPRLHVPGGVYHVILRGNGGEDIFFTDSDRSRFFLLLQEGTERFDYKLHAYCLMSNHVHLVMQVGDIPSSKIIQNLSFRYTKYINRLKSRLGHLFQGRYKALLVDADSYLLELVRYVHNNPVRAGLAAVAVDYKWSSQLAYLGFQNTPYLTTELILGQFGKRLSTCRKRFQEFVDKGKSEGHRKDLYLGGSDSRILGDDSFAEKVVSLNPVIKSPSSDYIVLHICKYYGIKEEEIKSQARLRKLSEMRGVVGWLCVQLKSATLTNVAERFNRDLATISRAVHRIEKRSRKSTDFMNQLNHHVSKLTE